MRGNDDNIARTISWVEAVAEDLFHQRQHPAAVDRIPAELEATPGQNHLATINEGSTKSVGGQVES